MKRFSLFIFCVLWMGLIGAAWGQSPLCPKGNVVIVPYVNGLVIPIVPRPDHCVADPADSDNDGMADSWELAWFGNLTDANGLGHMTDVDEDGISDLEEYERGGNPTVNDASAFIAANRCQQRYLPFGDAFNSDDCGQIKHAARVHDKGTDLHYNRARYYDAAVGQFLLPDPVRAVDLQTGQVNLEVLLEPQRLNPYAYALNNPYRYVDPFGELADDPDIGSPINLLMPGIDGTGAFSYDMVVAENRDFIESLLDSTSFTPAPNAAIVGGIIQVFKKKGINPLPNERTIQGLIDALIKKLGGNPTVQRGGQDLFRVRSKGHGQTGPTSTPQNVRNVTPDGRVFRGKDSEKPISSEEIREIYKSQTGQGTNTFRIRSGRQK